MSNIGDLVNLAYAASVRQIYPDANINISGEHLEYGVSRISTGKLINAIMSLRGQGRWRLAYGVLDEIVENRNVYDFEPFAKTLSCLCCEYGSHLVNLECDSEEERAKMEWRGIAALEMAVRLDPENINARIKLLNEYFVSQFGEDLMQLADESMKRAYEKKDTNLIRFVQETIEKYENEAAFA